jgi:hypothetical protein
MKVQIMSDLHVDFPGSLGVPPLVPGTDLVIVAGDTCQGLVKSVETVRHAYPPPTEIVMVAGNHEFWSKRLCYREHLEEGRLAAALHGVRFLENDVQTVGNVRLLGCTLYYMLFGETLLGAAMRSAADTMNDHRRIKGSRNPWLRFRPAEARVLHLRSRAFLERELAKRHPGPTICILPSRCYARCGRAVQPAQHSRRRLRLGNAAHDRSLPADGRRHRSHAPQHRFHARQDATRQ